MAGVRPEVRRPTVRFSVAPALSVSSENAADEEELASNCPPPPERDCPRLLGSNLGPRVKDGTIQSVRTSWSTFRGSCTAVSRASVFSNHANLDASVFGLVNIGSSDNDSNSSESNDSDSEDADGPPKAKKSPQPPPRKNLFCPSRRCSVSRLDSVLAAGLEVESSASGARYSLVRHLGRGAFGQVWLCTDSVSGEPRAIKLVPGAGASTLASEVEQTRRAGETEGSHVPKFYEASAATVIHAAASPVLPVLPELLAIVMQYVDGGSAGQMARQTRMPEHVATVVLHDTCKALAHLHEKSIIHRDVKGENILLSRDGICYLCDFGVSKIVDKEDVRSKAQRMTNKIGTPFFMAPEVGGTGNYDEKVDVWSLGITAIELAIGRTPWHLNGWAASNPLHVFHMLMNMPASPSVDRKSWAASISEAQYSSDFSTFLSTCIQTEPAKRPSSQSLLESSYLELGSDPASRRLELAAWLQTAQSESDRRVENDAHNVTSPSLPIARRSSGGYPSKAS